MEFYVIRLCLETCYTLIYDMVFSFPSSLREIQLSDCRKINMSSKVWGQVFRGIFKPQGQCHRVMTSAFCTKASPASDEFSVQYLEEGIGG